MKKILSIVLTAAILCTFLVSSASAALNSKSGLVSDPSITTLVSNKLDGIGTQYFYQIDIRTNDTITIKAINGKGQQVKVPKGGHAEWEAKPVFYASGKMRLTPSADGSTCSVKAVKGGQDVMISVAMYDKNGKLTFHESAFVQARYNVGEWIAEYLTLGIYGINIQAVFDYLSDNGGFAMLADMMGYYFSLLMPWEMFS